MQQRAAEEMEAQSVSASGLLENYQLNLTVMISVSVPDFIRG